MTFRIGDRIEYFRGGSGANPDFYGKIGTIVDMDYLGMVAIHWDHGCRRKSDSICQWSSTNCKLFEVSYDPNQMGDTEDDI